MGDNLTVGDVMDISDGTISEKMRVFSKYIYVDGVKQSAADGLSILRRLSITELNNVASVVDKGITGDSDPN